MPLLTRNPLPHWLRQLLDHRRHWRGGIHLSDFKQLSCQTPLQALAIEAGQPLAIPLGAGRRLASPCVQAGDLVLKGQVIGRGAAGVPWVHASSSGRVIAIEAVQPADGEAAVPAVLIAADGREQWIRRQPAPQDMDAMQLAEFALQMGITGLGGAGFPTGIKLAAAAEGLQQLLINGAECEPFISCDDRLMRERAGEIVAAADRLDAILRPQTLSIGIEGNKPQAIRALRAAVREAGSRLQVQRLAVRYPAGGQPMLVKALTGLNLLPGMLPAELGLLVLNVATLQALGRALLHGEPLVSRILTLTGAARWRGNLEVPVGLALDALHVQAQPLPDAAGIQIGGPMMGRRLSSDTAVVSKTTSCLIYGAEQLLPAREEAGQCIRCNHCVDACPMGLQPLHMLAALDDGRRSPQLDACIECGSCSHVCPSALPLRDSFRAARRLPVQELRP